METFCTLLQVVIALGIFNVWFLRLNKPTNYRGGNATSMEEEFRVYGLSRYTMVGVGTGKVILAFLLLVGLWSPTVVPAASAGMAFLMAVAVALHFKVHDPVIKSLPAAAMLLMSITVLVLSRSS